MTLYRVVWKDIVSAGAWKSTQEAKDWASERMTMDFESFGYILEDNEHYLVIASTRDMAEDDYNDISVIPKGVVVRVEKVTY